MGGGKYHISTLVKKFLMSILSRDNFKTVFFFCSPKLPTSLLLKREFMCFSKASIHTIVVVEIL